MTRLSGKSIRELSDVAVVPLSEAYISEIWPLWRDQYEEELSAGHALPDKWGSCQEEIQCYLRRRVKTGYAILAQSHDETIGFMVFDVFRFHGEETAFCPVVGHAAKRDYRRSIFEKLYQAISGRLVADGILNHIITYFAHDNDLKEAAFELGFGLIVVDAFRAPEPLSRRASKTNIIKANSSHVAAIEALEDEARSYYLEAPLFLTREEPPREYYHALLSEDTAIYLALSNNETVGVMQVRKNKQPDPITLSDVNTGVIDRIGAYIRPKYRGQGIGRDLLLKCLQWCQDHDITRIHVDFESANLSGRTFWLQYFTATMHSARRTIYRDVLQTHQT